MRTLESIRNRFDKMKKFQIILVVCFITCVAGSCINYPSEPCSPTVYTALNEYTRSAAYYDMLTSTQSDSSILEGWYRSTSPAGGDMPTYAPPNGYCQSMYPAWLQGSLPGVAEGIVQRTVCVHGLSSNCSQTINICVKNCVNYNVYYLYRPPSAYERYCFGKELPCQSGYGSSNGFTPGCQEINLLVENPSITYIVEETKSKSMCKGITSFKCNISHNITSVYLEVVWSVGGNIVKTEDLAYTSLPALITSTELASKGVSGNEVNLKCQMKARETQTSLLGNAKLVEKITSTDNGCQSYRNISCWDCTSTNGCTKKPATCLISEVCYSNGMENPVNSEELCSSHDDEYQWTSKDGSSLALHIGLGVISVVLCLILIVIVIGLVMYKGKRSEKGRVGDSMVNISQTEPGVRSVHSPPPKYCEVDPHLADRFRIPTQ